MSTPTRLDWRHAHQQTVRDTAAQLRDLRKRGCARFVLGDSRNMLAVAHDPSRMSDREIDEAAHLYAERVSNLAINQEVERRRRLGLPLHGMVDEV